MEYLNGGKWRLLGEYVEVESGGKKDRPELLRALAAARVHGATLVIAKLDRLARDAAFLLSLRDAGIEVVCADAPHMSRAELGMRAVFAEEERRWISERTRSALAAAKRRGVKLGTPANLDRRARRQGTAASAAARGARADEWAQLRAPIIAELRRAGAHSLRDLARGLNERDIPTARGRGSWSPIQVARLLARLDATDRA